MAGVSDAQNPLAEADEDGSDNNPAMMIFSAPMVRQLSTRECCFEPTYVGVRRVRPSSRVVQKAFQLTAQKERSAAQEENLSTTTSTDDVQSQRKKEEKAELMEAPSNGDQPVSSNIVFKVVGEDGIERRMTKKEKRALKQQIREEKVLAKKQRQEQNQRQQQDESMGKKKKGKKRPWTEEVKTNDASGNEDQGAGTMLTTRTTTVEQQEGEYFESKSNEIDGDDNETGSNNDSWIQQELADLKGERLGVPPVILSPPLAHVMIGGVLENESLLQIDDDLARDWADALKESMLPAEETRQKEDMRNMVYHLIPEVWTRFRPETLGREFSAIKDDESQLVLSSHNVKANVGVETDDRNEGNNDTTWRFVSIRPLSRSSFDSDLHAVVKILHRDTSLHISCGAKFGCDLLLYDGPRNERHAFAGLRVISADGNSAIAATTSCSDTRNKDEKSVALPLLTAYCLAGYVRCLNKAAKLALLATVRREKQPSNGSTICRVAFVDVKLERVDGTKKKDLEVRLQNLQKAGLT